MRTPAGTLVGHRFTSPYGRGGVEAVEIVEMLVAAGADVNALDDRLQENALWFALREYQDELEPAIRLFRERGAEEPGAAPEAPSSPKPKKLKPKKGTGRKRPRN